MDRRGRWKRTAKHRAAIAATMQGSKRGPYKTRADKGKARKPFSAEHRAKLSAAKVGKPGPWAGIKRGPQSAEWRANIAKSNLGKPAYFPMRRYHYKGAPLRSSWELLLAKIFDDRGIRWQFEPRKFDLGVRTYTPDFYVPEQDCYWEVKGYFGPMSKQTIALFREKYPDLSLVVATEKVLRAFGATHEQLRTIGD